MCFVLNIFNSCKKNSSAKKKTSQKSKLSNKKKKSNLKNSPKLSDNQHRQFIHITPKKVSIGSITKNSDFCEISGDFIGQNTLHHNNLLDLENEKLPIISNKIQLYLSEFDSDEIEFDNKSFKNNDINNISSPVKTKLLYRSKSDKFNSLTKYSNVKKHQILNKSLKYKNITDYCNDCGYYCCECDINQNLNVQHIQNNQIASNLDLKNSVTENIENNILQETFNLNKNSSLDEKEFSTDLNINYLEFKTDFPITPSTTENSLNNLTNNHSINLSSSNIDNNQVICAFQSSLSLSNSSITENKLDESEIMNSPNTTTTNQCKISTSLNLLNDNLNKLNVSSGNNGTSLNLDSSQPVLVKKHIPNDINGSMFNSKPNPPNENLSMNNIDKNNNNDYSTLKNDMVLNSPIKKRPMLGMTSISQKKSAISNNHHHRLLHQPPQLGLEKVNMKKNKFFFDARNELFTKPQEDDDLSRELEKEKKDSYNRQHKIKQTKGGKITISSNQVYDFKETDLKELGQIGNGEFGTVHKALHTPSQTLMAIKRIGPTVGNQVERKKVLKELDFVLECNENEFVVKFYGVKFNNEPADCLICMELMDTSLEKFYKFVYNIKKEEIPEDILGKVVVATINGLDYLREKHSIIHRDVKPSNMLINKHGEIKMCDFGISGKLVDSIAASRDAGCQLYMAPERIDPCRAGPSHGYDVRSDIWSLGISLYELASGKFPYPSWTNIFNQLSLVVQGEAPRLKSERLTPEFCDFVNTCLTKDEKKRPKYKQLKEHALFQRHSLSSVNISEYVKPYITEMLSIEPVKK